MISVQGSFRTGLAKLVAQYLVSQRSVQITIGEWLHEMTPTGLAHRMNSCTPQAVGLALLGTREPPFTKSGCNLFDDSKMSVLQEEAERDQFLVFAKFQFRYLTPAICIAFGRYVKSTKWWVANKTEIENTVSAVKLTRETHES